METDRQYRDGSVRGDMGIIWIHGVPYSNRYIWSFYSMKHWLQIIGLGILAAIFHWKTIVFYLFVTGCFFLMLSDQGIIAALMVIPIAWLLDKAGKLF